MAQRQRVRRSPRDAALALDPLEIANQQQAKIPPRRQRRPPHRLGVETLALPLHERVEPALLQHLVQALIERMRHCPRQLAVRHPELLLLLPLPRSSSHGHARSVSTVAVNHSAFIANANPDFHHGLLGREIVRISLIVRKLGFTNFERKRLIDRVNKTVDTMRSLDRQISNLEKKIESTRSEELKKDYRKTQRRHRADLEKLESDAGVSFKELHRTQREMIQGEMDAEQA